VHRVGSGTQGKHTRRVDVAALDGKGNPVEFHQVGDITGAGAAVAREVRAIIGANSLLAEGGVVGGKCSMGRQVGFWMLEEDENEFVRFVLSRSNVVILRNLSSTTHPTPSIALPRANERWWWSAYFWDRDFPFEPVRWVQVKEGPDRGLYAFGRTELPLIEFHRSILRESGELSEGRIWTGCTDPAFLKWYDRLADWIRKRYKVVKKRGNSNLYAGQHAWEWNEAGGVFAR